MIVVPCASFSCLIWMSVCAYVYATDPSLILRALGARWRKTKALGCSSQASKSLKKGSRQKTAMVLDHTPVFWLVCCFSLLVFFLSHTHSTVYIPHYWQSRVERESKHEHILALVDYFLVVSLWVQRQIPAGFFCALVDASINHSYASVSNTRPLPLNKHCYWYLQYDTYSWYAHGTQY
jgi:hypothetical protein